MSMFKDALSHTHAHTQVRVRGRMSSTVLKHICLSGLFCFCTVVVPLQSRGYQLFICANSLEIRQAAASAEKLP